MGSRRPPDHLRAGAAVDRARAGGRRIVDHASLPCARLRAPCLCRRSRWAGLREGSRHPVTMRVSLFVTCLADQLWPAAAAGAVEVLRRVGCSVEFDERQTCCGQPAFNTGYRPEACSLARRLIEIFESSSADAIVSPSGSCTAMLHHYEPLFEDAGSRARAHAVAERTHELSAFLVNRLGVEDVGASFAGRLTWHDACHGLRDLK